MTGTFSGVGIAAEDSAGRIGRRGTGARRASLLFAPGIPGLVFASSGADKGTILEYLAGVAPSATATTTDGSGTGVFADHPPGPTTFSIKDATTGDMLGSVDAFIRAGFLSIVLVTPSP